MYDDLFGDLPMAKGGATDGASASNEKSISESKVTIPSGKKGGNDKSVNVLQNQNNDQFTNTSSSSTKSSTGTSIPKYKSIVQSLGNAGKTTSFIPLALRRKRQLNSNSNSAIQTKRRSLGSGGLTSSQSSSMVSATAKNTEPNESTAVVIGKEENRSVVSINKQNNPPGVIQPVGNNEIKNIHASGGVGKDGNLGAGATVDADNIALIEDIEHEQKNDDEYTESEEMQKLHSSVHPYDMYDPMEPNDYLMYRKNKKNEILRKDLERQARKTLELQQQLREHIEEERKKVLESGDVDKIIENAGVSGISSSSDGVGRGRGRGRGRGLSNLPAWLIQKQKEKEQQQKQHDPTRKDQPHKEGQFDHDNEHNSKNGCTVILTNMVGPGEVDDELQDEVKEECEEKCGKVINIKIEERDQVQVFVTFQNVNDAKSAPAIFDGRMFGQRQISAKLL